MCYVLLIMHWRRQVSTHPNINMEGWSTLFSIFSSDKQEQWIQWRYPCTVVASRIPYCVKLIQQPRQSGVVVWTLLEGAQFAEDLRGQSQLWGDGGAKGEALEVSTFQRKWKLFWFCHYCCFCVICVCTWKGLEAESTSQWIFKFTTSHYLQ